MIIIFGNPAFRRGIRDFPSLPYDRFGKKVKLAFIIILMRFLLSISINFYMTTLHTN